MVALTKLFLWTICSTVGICSAKTDLVPAERGKQILDTYMGYGGCYQQAMAAIKTHCNDILINQETRDKGQYSMPHGLFLLLFGKTPTTWITQT